MDVHDVVSPHFVAHLPDGFQEGQALYVAHRSAYFDDDDLGSALLGEADYLLLDGVGDVGDGLDGAAQEFPATLLGNDLAVDLPGGDVGGPRQVHVDEPLVVAQV